MTNATNNTTGPSKNSKSSVGRRAFLGTVGSAAVATTVAGCIEGRGGAGASGPLTIGHLAPLEISQGLGSDRSAKLAVDEINDDGGIADRDVEVVSANTRADPSTTHSETERLIQEEEVDVLVGTFSSEATQAILDLVGETGVPFLITGSAAPTSITEFIGQDYEGYKSVFRSGPINSNLQAEAMADYAEYLSDLHGWSSYGFLADDAAWTKPFSNLLPDKLESRGFDVVHEDRLSLGIDDFGPVVSDLSSADPDAVFRFFAHIIGGGLLGAWHQEQLEFGIEGIHVASMTPGFYEATEGAATYETTSQSGAAGVTDITDKTIPFVDAYQETYADDDDAPSLPMYMGFNTYDAIYVYKNAIERADTADYEGSLDDIVSALLETDHTGTAGQISFYGADSEYPHDLQETRDDDGKIANFPITQWRPEGEIECVYPEAYRTDDHVAPHWM